MARLMYEEKLTRLGLFLLEFRRMRGDLIETYKILTGLDRVDAERIFPKAGGPESGWIRDRLFRMEVRRPFFTQRVVSLWNS